MRKKPAPRSRKTDTTKAVRECGSTTFRAVNVQDNIKPSKSVMKRLEKEILSFFVEGIIGKSTASIGPFSPSGCAKNVSNAVEIGLGRRPRNSWDTFEAFAGHGWIEPHERAFPMVVYNVKVVKVALPFEIVDSRLFEDDYRSRGVSL